MNKMECYFNSGNTYTGETIRGFRQGLGTMKYPNGDTYFGSWYKGKLQGLGVLLKKDGTIAKGYYKDGIYVKDENFHP